MKKLFVVLMFVVGYVCLFGLSSWFFNSLDEQWESRAKNAGYYEQLPKEMQR